MSAISPTDRRRVPPEERMVPTAIHLEPAHRDALKAISDRTKVPMAALIRLALDAYLIAEYGRRP